MSKFTSRLLRIPEYGDHESNVVARMTYNAAIGLVLLSALFVTIVAFAAPTLLKRAIVLAITFAFTSFGIIILLRQQRLQIASTLLVGVMWLTVTFGAISAGGISTPIFIGYIVVILVSGLIPNNRIGITISIASILTGILIVIAELKGLLPPAIQYSAIARLSIYT